jgi:hypothetical protein
VQPDDMRIFSGVVFKVQANMDANHRDRIAFVRMASGKYTPGMKLKVMRTSKELRPTSVVTFMSQRREAVEEAYAGDIVGFTTHGGVQLGDTITDGTVNLQFTGSALLCPRAVHDRGAEKPLAHQAVAARPGPVGRRRRHSGVSPRRWAATCCWVPWASCSLRWCSTASKASTTLTFAGRLPVHRRALDHRRHPDRAAASL